MEDGELDGEDALVEATVTVGVGEGIPYGEDVGGRKKRSRGSDKSAHYLGRDKSKNASILRKYGSIVWGKRQIVYSGFCTNMILSKISPAETATRT